MWGADQRNVDFVTENGRGPIEWRFEIRPEATHGAGLREDQLNVLERVWDLLEELVIPLEVEYTTGAVDVSATGETLRESFSNVTTSQVSDEDGVSIAALSMVLDSVDTPPDTAPAFIRVDLVESKTKIRLAGGDHWITPASNRYVYWHRGERTDTTPRPLFKLSFKYMLPGYATGYSEAGQSPPIYWLSLYSTSDIWLDETEISSINRERLHKVIEGIHESLAVAETTVTTEQFLSGPQVEHLEQISGTEISH